jgi:hypothetical protein
VSRADDIRAKANRIKAGAAQSSRSEDVSTSSRDDVSKSSSAVRSPRVRPIRVSVDISPVEHERLIDLGVAMARELGSPRVNNREILRSLLRLALDDPALIERVRAEVEEMRREER